MYLNERPFRVSPLVSADHLYERIKLFLRNIYSVFFQLLMRYKHEKTVEKEAIRNRDKEFLSLAFYTYQHIIPQRYEPYLRLRNRPLQDFRQRRGLPFQVFWRGRSISVRRYRSAGGDLYRPQAHTEQAAWED